MNGIAAAVILYKPDEEALLHHIQSYLPFVDELFAIDNTGLFNEQLYAKLLLLPGKIQYIANPENKGVAAALNTAAALASERNHQWLLTMDQDSYFETADISTLLDYFNRHFYHTRSIAIVAPSVSHETGADSGRCAYSQVVSVITSGSLLQLPVWKEAGMFDEKLFIDEVDHDFCYRAIIRGFAIIRFNNIKLQHMLGTKKRAGYLGTLFTSNRTIHSPARVYFMIRNYLYVRKKYRRLLPEAFKARDRQILTTLKNNILFSGKFIQNLKSVSRAIADFRKGDFSAKI